MNQQETQFDPVVARRNRRIFVGLVILFATPFVIAIYMYKSGWRPATTMNHGTLVQPPRPAPEFKLSIRAGGHFDQHGLEKLWNYVVVTVGACDQACLKNLHAIRQIQIAQGKNQHRIRRILIHTGNDAGLKKIAESYPKLVILEADSGAFSTLRTWFTIKDQAGKFDGSRVYLVDPLGNYMMYYLPGYDPTGMRKDMARLLKVSHIG
ncbi:MAG: hypothetical protein R3188_05540 [Acidiferrobacterales bacterium]|nr:hypothetical protein [Acidiferrobacterales bacterium]